MEYTNVYNDDYIICPICNNKYKRLCNHFATKHKDINFVEFQKLHPEYLYVSKSMHNQLATDTLKQWENSEFRELMVNKTKKQWENEEFRKLMSINMIERLKKWNENDTDGSFHKQCLENLGHSFGGRIHYKDYLFRSELEVKFAKLLDEYGIKYEYETIQIPYILNDKKHIYFPDFYLPEYNLILEVKPKELTWWKLNKIKYAAAIDNGYNIMYATEHTTVEDILNNATTIESVS